MTTNPGDQIEEELRRRLAFHFMDPVDKFIARRQVPWKLLLQFLKGMRIILYFNKLLNSLQGMSSIISKLFFVSVMLVTAQLCVFGYYRYAHSNYYSDNHIGFEHLFLGKHWDPVREIDTYPPATGTLALYEKVQKY